MKFNKLTCRALALAIGTSMVFSQPAFAQVTQVTGVVEDGMEFTQEGEGQKTNEAAEIVEKAGTEGTKGTAGLEETEGTVETEESKETVSGNLMENVAADNENIGAAQSQDAEKAAQEVDETLAQEDVVQEDVVQKDATQSQGTEESVPTKETEELLEEEVVEGEVELEDVTQEAESETLEQAGAAEEETYLTISSARELKEFAQKVNNGTSYKGKLIKLTNDIQFDGVTPNNFTPIGNSSSQFQGTFDGCGYTISGIIVIGSSNGGLFGNVGSNGIVKNVTVKDSQFSGSYLGAIVAYNDGGLVDNCHNRNVELEGGKYVGGIVGYNEKGEIVNCSSTGFVSSARSHDNYAYAGVGGIVGYLYFGGSVKNSCNMGTVEFKGSSDYSWAGGVIGRCYIGGTINNCYNVGVVTNSNNSSMSGGITGGASIVSNSYCSEESSERNFAIAPGTEINNKALPASSMQTQDFVNQLNKNIGDNTDYLEWEIRPEESSYPLPAKLVNISDCTVTVASPQVEYNGAFQTPQVALSYNGKSLVKDKDYTVTYQNNRNVGKASVVIKGLGRFIDSTTANFTIVGKNISKTNIVLSGYSYGYTGGLITPSVVVKDGNITLQPNKDYTVGYYNNVNIGTATVVVAGKGNYAGSVNKAFTIVKGEQNVICSSYFQIAYGTAATSINVSRISGDGQITYASSNSKVVAIDGNGKMTFKNIGTAVIGVTIAETANFKGKTIYATVNVVPKKTTLSSVKVKGNTITVKWKKDKKASGYILQYSTSKNFKKNVKTITISKNKTVSKKIKGLKGKKKYYVRVCSYKKVSGKKVQGAYSVVKGVKTKK